MKKNMLSGLFILITYVLYGQSDTNLIYNSSELVKGFYSNYNEYLNNSPSTVMYFTTKFYCKSKKDSSIVGAEYKLFNYLDTFKTNFPDPGSDEKLPNIWGFCDGKNVYVKSVDNNIFWRLEHLGKNPFFLQRMEKSSTVPFLSLIVGVPLSIGITSLLPTNYILMYTSVRLI
jgi:hypothetical protein